MRYIYALLLALGFTTPASAALQPISLDTANQVAKRWTDQTVEAFADADYQTSIVSSSYDCDHVTSSRLGCEISYELVDGDLCDESIFIRRGGSGRVRVTQRDEMMCDGDEDSVSY